MRAVALEVVVAADGVVVEVALQHAQPTTVGGERIVALVVLQRQPKAGGFPVQLVRLEVLPVRIDVEADVQVHVDPLQAQEQRLVAQAPGNLLERHVAV